MPLLSSPKQTHHSSRQPRQVVQEATGTRLASNRKPFTLIEQWCRELLVERLLHIEHGSLLLEDSTGIVALGHDSPCELSGVIQVKDPRFYRSVAWGGSMGAAEAFMRGYWDSPDLTMVMRVMARNAHVLTGLDLGSARLLKPLWRWIHWLRRNTKRGSQRNITAHYDLSDEFFAAFLDPTMSYSAAIFDLPDVSLEEASQAKFRRLCQLLELSAHDHLLEIGTGWGGLALYAAREYGCRVTTTTISPAQYEYASRKVLEAGLADRIQVLQQDYRELSGQYDKLVSVEMIEAVGHNYLGTYFAKCDSLLRKGGRFALQTITIPEEREQRYLHSVDFIQKYIFPGGCLPSVTTLSENVAGRTKLRVVALDEFGGHYAETLARWHQRFTENCESIKNLGMSEQFILMWHYYFSYCEAGFREEMTGLKQILLIKSMD
ncbi:SAM-dependent methyltransferase [Bythopirellula polymerisocia]|uniref:Cyclopropane-fatty-acyl-phospholipid synthase n=1 Tax=Bythopirellula polymerisocia TaxID=2528003 RepID=A0A5C6CVD4_9BACT|nr:cyclopropane-fatty-acyl-phospholipid synthase family protein [Bythopirellula polymerisocia]TWU27477.1 Cyclopropane-fatty-acyl-phospholipid synthase [Bythopirellula polymerisocia]